MDIKDCTGIRNAAQLGYVCANNPILILECGSAGTSQHTQISTKAIRNIFFPTFWGASSVKDRTWKCLLHMYILRRTFISCGCSCSGCCSQVSNIIAHLWKCRQGTGCRKCYCLRGLLHIHAQGCLSKGGCCKVPLCHDMKLVLRRNSQA